MFSFVLIAVMVVVLMQGNEPVQKKVPKPEPTEEPVLTVKTVPVPETVEEPVVKVVLTPTPVPVPKEVPKPVPKPTPKEVPKPVPKTVPRTVPTPKPKPTPPVVAANGTEKELLARLVEAEASGESYAGKVAVADVVLNRVESNEFPDTIKGVIYQKRQFTPVVDGSINNPASAASKQAVQQAMSTSYSSVGDALYFYNSKTATSRWLDSLQTVKVIGSHTFKR